MTKHNYLQKDYTTNGIEKQLKIPFEIELKIESCANKYTFVWKKAVTKNLARLLENIAGLRQYRTKIVPQMRRQFFRQNVQNERS